MSKYIISEHQNGLMYAYYKNLFWFWDKDQKKWISSSFAEQRYKQALQKDSKLTPEIFMDSGDFYTLDEYEIPMQRRIALETLTSADCKAAEDSCSCAGCKRTDCTCAGMEDAEGRAECDGSGNCKQSGCSYNFKHQENPTQAAPASPTSSDAATAAANQPAATQAVSDLASMTEETAVSSNDLQDTAVGSNLAGAGGLPSFDYSGLDDQTVADLHLAEREYLGGRKLAEMGLRRMADGVAIAHDTLCGTVVHNVDNSKHGNRGEESFRRWCESMQIGKSTAYKLLQVSTMFDKSTPREQKVLEELSPSLLYAAAKPSAPAELVQAVKDRDITTHKQFQELLEKYKSEQQARQAERESTSALLRDEQQRRQKADEARIAADRRAESAQAEVDEARRREVEARAAAHKYHVQVEEVEAQRNALLDQQTEYIDRIHELESRPVEVAVQEPTEEQIAAAAKQRTAMLEAQVRSLQADKDSALRQLDELGNTAYMAAAEFADNAARTVDSIRTAFWALAKELSEDDFADALAPLDEVVRKIYEREWDDEESET